VNDRAHVDAIRAALADPFDVCQRLGLLAGAKNSGGNGGGRLVRCPAHPDRTASCSVTRGPDGTLRVACFGCALAGDVFDLVAAVEGLDRVRGFRAVLARAAELAGLADGPGPRPAPRPPRAAPPPEAPPPLADDRFARLVLPLLASCPIAGDVEVYLRGRALLAQALADGWGALPAPEAQPALLARLADERRDEAEERRAIRTADGLPDMDDELTSAELDRSGLFSRGRFSHPEARLVIPWRRPDGLICNLQRRRIGAGEPRYVGPAGRSFAWPYGVERLAAAPPAVPVAFVEGAVDALALRAILADKEEPGIVLGLPGLAGWRTSWAALARGRVAVVAVDADDAGDRHVKRFADELAEAGAVRIERWTPPAKDWGDALTGERRDA
jgi:Toprim-like